jgi:putative transposase
MPSTFLSLHYHLVFSTKDRDATISKAWRSRLHQYLGGVINGLGGQSQGVGGMGIMFTFSSNCGPHTFWPIS